MKARDGITESVWSPNGSSADVPALAEPPAGIVVDVCVVGAGISGLTAAYLLAKDRKRVVVVDEGPIGSGQTSRTSAHLASALDDRFAHVERLLGVDAIKTAYESHAAAIDQIERIARDEKIDCEFSRLDAYLFLGDGDDRSTLEGEVAAARRAGFAAAQLVDGVPGLEVGPAIRFPNQGRFEPMKYLDGLARAFTKLGGRIYAGKRVTDVAGAQAKKGTPCIITFEDESTLRAAAAIVATNTPAPINDWTGIYTKQSAYRTYMVGLRIARDAVPDALYWDTLDPYHYVRFQRSTDGAEDVLLVGGEDHKVGQPGAGDKRFAALEAWARQTFPGAGERVAAWSGQVQEPGDGVAFIGRAPTGGENVFVITGDSGMGLTHGTLGAMLVRDQIMGRPNPWEALYAPTRKETNLEFVKENANVTAQYADLLTGGDVKDESEIAPGSGAVMRAGLSKLAVYRDPSGAITKCSAICTHLYCVVSWNDVEKSWDCPCHGSRFDPTGRVVMGPAVKDLKAAE